MTVGLGALFCNTLSVVYYLPMADSPIRRNAPERVHATLAAARQPRGVAELVQSTGLHENAVRRALRDLGLRGMVHRVSAPASGHRGRPRLLYAAVGDPATPYRELLPLALSLAGARDHRDGARSIGRAHGLARQVEGEPLTAALASLARLGFGPELERPEDAQPARVRLTTCPFAETVTDPDALGALCALHHGILEGTVERCGGRLERFAVAPPTLGACRADIRSGPGPAAGRPSSTGERPAHSPGRAAPGV